VGEGPGRKEEVFKTGFIGQSGSLLDDTLSDVGISRWDVFATNAALCRGDTDKEADRAAECCAPRLARELSSLDPGTPIVPLGKQAAKSVLGTKSILLVRGFVWRCRDLSSNIKTAESGLRKAERQKDKGAIREAELRVQTLRARQDLKERVVFPTVHPAFVLRADAWTPILKLDLDRARRWADGELKDEDLEDRIERVDTLEEFRTRERVYLATDDAATLAAALAVLDETVSCDIETESVDPLSPLLVKILCVGVGDTKRVVVFGPWREEIHAGVLTKALASRKTVFHNGYNFDALALGRDGAAVDPARMEDTLIAHHAFAGHMPQRLDHVVSVFLDARPWKVRFGRRQATEKGLPPQDMTSDDLHFYNSCDVILTARVWHAMQNDLRDETKVYAHDKATALLCEQIQETGFRVDRKRKRLLSKLLKRRAAALKGRLRSISGVPDLSPGRLGEIRRILFTRLRAPMLNPTGTGLASTSNATLEELKKGRGKAAKFADALLRWRVVGKIRSTYIEAVKVHKDDRAHFNWKSFGAVSGRWSCRMQSVPRWSTALEERVREMYVAAPNHDLYYFDLCFTGDTLIDGPTGAKPIRTLAVGDLVYTYRASTRRPAIGKITQHLHVGRKPILKVTLDNGEVVRCTPEHKWIVLPRVETRPHKKGPWPCGGPTDRLARDLQPGDRLLPLRKQIVGGRERLYAHDAFTYSRTHVEVAATVYGPRPTGHDVHHKNEDSSDNVPSNLEYKHAAEHQADHGRVQARRQWADPKVRAKMTRALRRATAEGKTAHYGAANGRYNPAQICALCGAHKTTSLAKFCSRKCYGLARTKTRQPCAICGRQPTRPTALFCARKCKKVGAEQGLNHKVVSIEPDGCADVWSIAVAPDHNYALAAGVFVRNSQAEARMAANLSGDPAFLNTCKGDVHVGNALVLFPDAREMIERDPKGKHCLRHGAGGSSGAACNCGKPYRDVAKNAGFAVAYLAEVPTVFAYLRAQGFDVELGDVEEMLSSLKAAYKVYYAYVEANIAFVKKHGFLPSPLIGRKSWFGYAPKPTDVANRPIQGGIADVMNERLVLLSRQLPKTARVVGQYHDAAIIEGKKGDDRIVTLINALWEEPVRFPESQVCPEAREFFLPTETKRGRRWSEF
jgi:DNA polymerase I-like protein with 3'-5' exonuclease and polymerase domains/uracil-DNA glycosylase